MVALPAARGPLSEHLLALLSAAPPRALPAPDVPAGPDPLGDDDLHLALYLCYELHYRGLPGVDERWEWEPSLLTARGELERRFERALLEAVPFTDESVAPSEIDLALREIAGDESDASVSSYVRSTASVEELREFVVHRSAYQLKEADPHSWAIP